MPRDDSAPDLIINGKSFKRVKLGLDEREVVPYIQALTEERDELSKHQDTSPTLTRFIEKIAKEADEYAEQTKKEARDQAAIEASSILSKAQEQASQYYELKKTEANERASADAQAIMAAAQEQANIFLDEKTRETFANSQKQAELLQRQTQLQIEAWVQEIKDNITLQLRNASGFLHNEMRAQAEELKHRAAAFETDFEKQLSDIKKREITLSFDKALKSTPNSMPAPVDAVVKKTVSEPAQNKIEPQKSHSTVAEKPSLERKWVEIQIASGDPAEIKAFRSRLERQSEIGAAQEVYREGKQVMAVMLRAPIDLIQKLMSFPEVKQAREVVENQQIIYLVALAKSPARENTADVTREKLGNLKIEGSD